MAGPYGEHAPPQRRHKALATNAGAICGLDLVFIMVTLRAIFVPLQICRKMAAGKHQKTAPQNTAESHHHKGVA